MPMNKRMIMPKVLQRIKEQAGYITCYEHSSQVCGCPMQFSVYLPPQAEQGAVPVLYWLSGLTCTDQNFREKAGAQRYAAELGIALVIPDTSPRGETVPDDEGYDLGQGAGFYLNATEAPWATHYQMYDYITDELPATLAALDLPLSDRRSISGHSMGGHGALTIGLRNPGMYRSVSAFAPICHPTNIDWGQKAFTAYLGTDQTAWQPYDACCLLQQGVAAMPPILIDQGTADEFYAVLSTEDFVANCARQDYPAQVRFQEGYDHSYHFVTTFIEEHLRWHLGYMQG